MKTIRYILTFALLTLAARGQNIETLTAINGADVVKATDWVMVRDASVASSNNAALRKLSLAELVNVPSLFSSVPDGTFTIAKTSGLSAALDGKVALNGGNITDKAGFRGNLNLSEFRPEDYGATGDGTTDDTADFTEMIAAMPARGGVVILGSKTYVINGLVTSKEISIRGAGCGIFKASEEDEYGPTTIKTTSYTAWALVVNAPTFSVSDVFFLQPHIWDLAGPNAYAGGGIQLNLAGGSFHIDRCKFSGSFVGVHAVNGVFWTITNSSFVGVGSVGVLSESPLFTDAGDYSISGCIFSGEMKLLYPDAAVKVLSGGGLRFENNKINGFTARFNTGVYIHMTGGTSSVCNIIGNSIENVTNYGVLVNTVAPHIYGYLHVVGNEFGYMATGVETQQNTHHSHISENRFIDCTTAAIKLGGNDDFVGTNSFHQCASGIVVDAAAVRPVIAPTQNYAYAAAAATKNILSATGGGWTSTKLNQEVTLDTAFSGSLEYYRITLPTYNGGVVGITIQGIQQGAGAFLVSRKRSWFREAGAITLATVGTDIAVGGGAANCDASIVALDNSNLAFYVVKANGSAATGKVRVETEGGVQTFTFKQ